MHPRHIALISDEAREALADILNAVEAHGQFPTEAQSLIVALFDKPAGGTRPIGWYRAIFRVWAKARRNCWRSWERRSGEQMLFGAGEGRTVEDIVWRQAVRAEINTISGGYSGAVLYDLMKCYEFVRHIRLIREGIAHDFPMHELRLTIRSYRWARHVTHGGLLHTGVLPTKGIVAGCAAATTELKLYMFKVVSGVVYRHPRANLEIFIDDITAESHERNANCLVEGLSSVAVDLKESLEEECGFKVSLPKTAVVCSDDKASERIARAMGAAAAGHYQVRNLGIDFTVGKKIVDWGKQRKSHRGRRFGTARRRTARARKVLGMRKHCLRIWTTGIAPGLHFGAACTGYQPSVLKWARGKASILIPGGGQGAHQSTVFVIHQCQQE